MNIEPLKTGSIVKIWHGNRGHDYVVLGVQGRGASKKLGLLKNSCLNEDGKIRSNTKVMHSWVDVEQMEDYGVANKISRVCGTRAIASRGGVADFVRNRLENHELRALKASDEVYANFDSADARLGTSYQ